MFFWCGDSLNNDTGLERYHQADRAFDLEATPLTTCEYIHVSCTHNIEVRLPWHELAQK